MVALLLIAVATQVTHADRDQISVEGLKTEYLENPIGTDPLKPRFSWQIRSPFRDTFQSAYRVRVATSKAELENDPVWDSGHVESGRSLHVVYEGPPPDSRTRYYWQVRVWDAQGRTSAWSEPAFWETGLRTADWAAAWISPGQDEDASRPGAVPMVRTTFEIEKEVASARLYISSLGLYEARINGRVVGDRVFTPGWTSYRHRLQYQTYDVTDQLQQGRNALGALLGDGWYRGHLAWDLRRNVYGDRLGILAQLEIEFRDGSRTMVSTNERWAASTGPILSSDLYMGEVYDARLEQPGWDAPGFDDSSWTLVEIVDHPKQILVAPESPPVRRTGLVDPAAIFMAPSGNPVVDMGQNMVGRVRIRVSGPEGTRIKLRHAEELAEDGGLYTENLRKATQEDVLILAEHGERWYEPVFTFHGFRYVEVEGHPGELTSADIKGVVIHSDLRITGRFETSNELVNRLHHNIVWGQKGNFLDVPTDCPQRDERLGWTGDAQVFAPTAAFNMLVAPFFSKWLADLEADQLASGSVPWVIPDVLGNGIGDAGGSTHGATGWGDAAVIVPWTMYQLYGDSRILERQFSSMRAWVDYMRARAGERLIWEGDEHFGDWLAYAPAHPGYPGATTSKDLLATAHFFYSARLVARTAAILGLSEEEQEYGSLSERVRLAFQSEFVTSGGRLVSDTQTAYTLALAFDLMPDALRSSAAGRLAENVRSRGHITTGFLGTPLISHVLTEFGYLDLAYALLLREDYPSWLYPVTQGATTVWERWDSRKPDGSFQDPGMNSFNHYAYGAIGDWMYRVIGGINHDPDEPGYRRILIRPRPGGDIRWAKASLETMYGPVRSEWTLSDGRLEMIVEVPPNTEAAISIPNADIDDLTEGGQPIRSAVDESAIRQDGRTVEVRVGSGVYRFTRLRAG